MGRGRSKAKQTKVARDLKYSNQDMDLESLAKELHGESTVGNKNNQDSDSNSTISIHESKFIKHQN
jgi:hypothetical protein